MPAEKLEYENDFFDCIIARDILHHVDIPVSIQEAVRVARNGAILVVNEIYTHSSVDRIRRWRVVDRYLYPAMQKFIYGTDDPYLTPQERKLNERDVAEIAKPPPTLELEKHFNVFVARLVPDRFDLSAKVDRLLLILLKPFARFLAGRILLAGRISK